MINTQDVQEEILTRLDALGAKLGVAADHLWEVFTQQALMQGIGKMAVMLVIILTSLYLLKKGFKNRPFFEDRSEVPKPSFFFMIIGAIMGLIGFILMGDGFVTALTQIFNPEYHAWLEVKDVLK